MGNGRRKLVSMGRKRERNGNEDCHKQHECLITTETSNCDTGKKNRSFRVFPLRVTGRAGKVREDFFLSNNKRERERG